MNLLKPLLLSLCTIVLLAACGGNDQKSSAGKLQGTWEIKRAEGIMAAMNVGTIYEFSGNKLTLRVGDIITPGTTGITDSTFSFQPDGHDRKYMYHYRFNGDTLVADIDISEGQTFYLVRK